MAGCNPLQINQNKQAQLQRVLHEAAFGLRVDGSQDFFEYLVTRLAESFGAAYAFIALLDEAASNAAVETIAVYARGKTGGKMNFYLAGTPCANVVGKSICAHPSNVQADFPDNRLLVEMEVDSYIGAPLFDAEGKPLGLLAVLDEKPIDDLELKAEMLKIYTLRAARELERRHNDEMLQEKERRFHSLASNIPGVIYRSVYDADRTMEFVSDGIADLSGYPADEFIGNRQRAYASIVHPDDAGLLEREIAAAVEEGRPYVADYRILDRHGEVRWVYEKGLSQPNGSGDSRWLDGVIFDVTDRKRAEDELEAHRNHLEALVETRTAELERANREMEAFSYSVSHDLRSPLRAIDGFSLAILEDCEDCFDATARDYFARIRKACRNMGELIDDLLKLSRVSSYSIEKQSVDLSAMACELAENIAQTQPGREVAFRIQPEISVVGDPHLLRVALDNLLSNAWKYTRDTRDPLIEFGLSQQADGACYFVRDNGSGFDMRFADKLFGVFQRLHGDDYEGSGIGLATVKRVIDRHDGRVWGEGTPGEGASFYFTL